MDTGTELFGRHLDLTPLRGRPSGLVRCIFHEDPAPSLSVDLNAGVFNCFGCGVQGGLKRFATLVGERAPESLPPPRPPSPAKVRARRVWASADDLRTAERVVEEARALATRVGESPATWELLAEAAALERAVWASEC